MPQTSQMKSNYLQSLMPVQESTGHEEDTKACEVKTVKTPEEI